MNIPTEMLNNSLEHRYGGNGWAVVDTHEGEWADCVYIGKGEVGNRITRVWSKLLTDQNIPIHHTLMEKIRVIRDQLASGEFTVKNSRLVKA